MSIILGLLFLSIFLATFYTIRERKLLETVTKLNRGTYTERNLVMKFLKSGIPAQTIFHDLYLQKSNNTYSQIDLAIVANGRLIVFEVKEYSGWIFGKGNQSNWTQVLAYGKRKFQFYNPILQNKSHITELRRQLHQFGDLPLYSVVVFYGDCVLKNVSLIPQGSFIARPGNVIDILESITKNNTLGQYANNEEIIRILKQAVKNGESKEIRTRHVESVKSIIAKNEFRTARSIRTQNNSSDVDARKVVSFMFKRGRPRVIPKNWKNDFLGFLI